MDTSKQEEQQLIARYDGDERAAALALHLNDKEATITQSSYDNEYIVNERTELSGTSPEQYIQDIKDLRELLTTNIENEITEYLQTVGNIKKETTDALYKKAKDNMNKMSKLGGAKAQAFERLKASSLYAENVLYHLLQVDFAYSSTTNITKSYRDAWLGNKPTDIRKEVTISDGGYLILTDDEANDAYKDSLQNYIDECILPEIPEPYRDFFDNERWVQCARSNGNRGNELNRYDGSEDYQNINGTEYYIYRTN